MGEPVVFTCTLSALIYTEGWAMLLRELLNDRYAILRNLKPRTVTLFGETLDRLAEFLGREPALSDLDDLTIAKFFRWRAVTPHRKRIPAPATVAKDKAHLTSLWNFAARKRLAADLQFPDLPRLKVPKKPPRGYTVAEVSALIRQAKTRKGYIGAIPAPAFWVSLLQAAWYSGERIGGLLAIRWAEVDLAGCRLTFLGGTRKGGIDTITRDISPQLAAMLRQRQGQPHELVWPWLEHRKEHCIYPSLRLLCRQAGVSPRGFHAIRKASGSYVKAAGGDATEHLGHANPRTTRDHYLDPTITGQQSALDFLPPLDLNGPGKQGDGDRPAA
jgi:integrase